MKPWPLLLIAASVPAWAEVPAPQAVSSDASGSAYFRLGPPGVYKAGPGIRLIGQVCRRNRSTQLSPYRVRIERLSPGGDVIGVASARVPAIYNYGDRACATYSASADWTLAPGEALRACFDRARPCSPQAPTKAAPSVPKA